MKKGRKEDNKMEVALGSHLLVLEHEGFISVSTYILILMFGYVFGTELVMGEDGRGMDMDLDMDMGRYHDAVRFGKYHCGISKERKKPWHKAAGKRFLSFGWTDPTTWSCPMRILASVLDVKPLLSVACKVPPFKTIFQDIIHRASRYSVSLDHQRARHVDDDCFLSSRRSIKNKKQKQ